MLKFLLLCFVAGLIRIFLVCLLEDSMGIWLSLCDPLVLQMPLKQFKSLAVILAFMVLLFMSATRYVVFTVFGTFILWFLPLLNFCVLEQFRHSKYFTSGLWRSSSYEVCQTCFSIYIINMHLTVQWCLVVF